MLTYGLYFRLYIQTGVTELCVTLVCCLSYINQSIKEMSAEGFSKVLNEREDDKDKTEHTVVTKDVPDGGWGWCVVAGGHFIVL